MVSTAVTSKPPLPRPPASLHAALEAILERLPNIAGELTRLGELLQQAPSVAARPHLRVITSVERGGRARAPWVALLDDRETTTVRHGVFVLLVFRADRSGVYLALNQGIAELEDRCGRGPAREALGRRAEEIRRRLPGLGDQGAQLHGGIDRRLGRKRSHPDDTATIIAHKLYVRGAIPPDPELHAALAAFLFAYDTYLEAPAAGSAGPTAGKGASPPTGPMGPTPLHSSHPPGVSGLLEAIARQGFSFEPWQIAAYITALRTKPFVILAGVSGTGKSRLPALCAAAMGGVTLLLPVRPDWTDSADVLGYVDLAGHFRPGPLLRFARAAAEAPDKLHVCILDEMNLARVEQYFAEVLSRIEDRSETGAGGFASGPLLAHQLAADDAFATVGLPPNLALVGTVNMDETTHGFSRKVLDRAFTLELSDIDLRRWEPARPAPPPPSPWPWPCQPRALRLGALALRDDERPVTAHIIDVLSDLNPLLASAQLHVGYRVRDEIVLFVLHAREIAAAFVTRDGASVDPLDLALHMKILPRIAGGSGAIRALVREMLGYAHQGERALRDEDADALALAWKEHGRPAAFPGARYPRTAARLALMWDRLLIEGFTSYWL